MRKITTPDTDYNFEIIVQRSLYVLLEIEGVDCGHMSLQQLAKLEFHRLCLNLVCNTS